MTRHVLTACLLLAALPARAGSPAAQATLLDQVPDAAVVAGAVRPGALELMRQYFRQTPDMQKDVGAYLTRRIGVDLTRVEGVAFWSTQLTPQPTFGAFVRVTDGTVPPLKGARRGSFDGSDLIAFGGGATVAAAVPGGLIVGDEQEVRVGLAVAHKHAPAIGPQSPLASLLRDSVGADLIAGLAASAVKDASMQALSSQYGAKTLSLVLRTDGLILLSVAGDAAKLKNAQQMLASLMNVVLAQARMKRDAAAADDKGDVAEGLGAIAGYHQLVAFWNEFNPKLEGDKLVGRYQLPKLNGTAMIVPLLGVGAAVAIPAFTKYVRRSKTTEASVNVRKLADGAAAYAAEQAPNKKAKFAFPKTTDWTPARACCGQPGDKCAPDPAAWQSPTWQSLAFSVEDPHYYQYRVVSEGKGPKARVSVEARGDLDCNGQFSSWKRSVTVDGKGTPQVGELQSTAETE